MTPDLTPAAPLVSMSAPLLADPALVSMREALMREWLPFATRAELDAAADAAQDVAVPRFRPTYGVPFVNYLATYITHEFHRLANGRRLVAPLRTLPAESLPDALARLARREEVVLPADDALGDRRLTPADVAWGLGQLQERLAIDAAARAHVAAEALLPFLGASDAAVREQAMLVLGVLNTAPSAPSGPRPRRR